ncbi:MAG TPA: EamA family transporter [Anaerolineales bacterium]|nr:EamA family transporter [Anaerolineales bacterium]
MKSKDWLAFGLLGLVWGSSFLWIKVAVAEVGPFTLVAWRLLFGLAALAAVVAVRRPAMPRDRRTLAALALLGITNTAVPFALISWGEQSIDSAVASILNGTVPLFTMVIAHLALHDDRMTLPRVVGLVTGFIGVVVLMSRDIGPQGIAHGVLGQAAVLAAAVFYAGSSVFARRNLRQVSPVVQAFLPLITADAFVWTGALMTESSNLVPQTGTTWVALAWLGVLGSCVAYLLYFGLLQSVGPTRATLVTYVFPVVGVALGVIFLGERLDLNLALGAALVVAGIGAVNWKPRMVPVPAASAGE